MSPPRRQPARSPARPRSQADDLRALVAAMCAATAARSHEHLGQRNTYVTWYRKHMTTKGDNPPVGPLLCTRKDHALVEYATARMDNRLFVSKYQLELPRKDALERFLETKRYELDEERGIAP